MKSLLTLTTVIVTLVSSTSFARCNATFSNKSLRLAGGKTSFALSTLNYKAKTTSVIK